MHVHCTGIAVLFDYYYGIVVTELAIVIGLCFLAGNYVSGFADEEDEKARARKTGE